MRQLTAYETSDGVLHLSHRDALRHAENRFGREVDRLAHALCQVDKITPARAFVEASIDSFVALAALRADLTLEPEQ